MWSKDGMIAGDSEYPSLILLVNHGKVVGQSRGSLL
jgi:hypothetical protein